MSHPSETIYLDHAATTPVRREVVEAMAPCYEDAFGNPSSRHAWGRRARRHLDDARASIADALGVPAPQVFFTRGGTESDNLALLGITRRQRSEGATPILITSAVEHPAVFDAAERAVEEGAVHHVVGVEGGDVDLDRLRECLTQGATVASFMWVNNETGLCLPMESIWEACQACGVPLHSDAVQAVGKVPVSLRQVPVDFLSVTGHKIYGPKGTGALVTSRPNEVLPLHFGGGQERGIRPGTEDVAGAVGLARALCLAVAEQAAEGRRLRSLRDEVEARVLQQVPDLRVNAGTAPRAPHILSLGVPETDADTLLAAVDGAGLGISGGSACASGSSKPSRTLTALYPDEPVAASLRLSFGRLNDETQVATIIQAIVTAIEGTGALLAS